MWLQLNGSPRARAEMEEELCLSGSNLEGSPGLQQRSAGRPRVCEQAVCLAAGEQLSGVGVHTPKGQHFTITQAYGLQVRTPLAVPSISW